MSGHRGNRRHANGWRRRQVVARVLAAYDTCHLCGRPVDKSLPPGLPGSPEVDEIIPVSKGGSPLPVLQLPARAPMVQPHTLQPQRRVGARTHQTNIRTGVHGRPEGHLDAVGDERRLVTWGGDPSVPVEAPSGAGPISPRHVKT